MDGDIAGLTIKLAIFVLLILLSGFFVSTEFAIVKVRSTRIDQLVEEGNKKAIKAKKLIENLDEYLSACQLGITITSLGLGWLGEPTVQMLLNPLFQWIGVSGPIADFVSFIIAFSIVTYLHVVAGELAPKTLAITKAEWVTLNFSGALYTFYKVMYPFIHLLNMSARGLARIFGVKSFNETDSAHTEEELRMIMADSFKSGEIKYSEFEYMNSIFEFSDRTAKEIMVPRTEITAIEKNVTLKEVFEVMEVEQYTRYPVIDGDKDHVLGLVNLKHLLTAYIKDPKNADRPVSDYMQPIIRVIETVPISDLLLKMQHDRIHMAILMDEYGGTSGLVTIEDIIEEIVGDIQDEFDEDEIPEVQVISDGHYIIDAKMLIDDVNEMLGTHIDDEDIDTIGGWFWTQRYDATEGDSFVYDGYEFKIKELDGHHILYIEVIKLPKEQEMDVYQIAE
ncbi:hemolysin family protein [Ureibacillus sp. FSL K6-8385]|uniref:HlyC/CorC family transporter n=1 Tax=Ureibacillus terrenus TaxID=118246 RepID=A0A540V210_9BACL|nr:hemolysin family protein [Ureibacillus terrenus]MED3661077.1 hemolysin family protein [Ureibacillus terrenus]MED3763366.1 hemolysin family protein [Ureibacillus terrenus]TQE90779.1 HlyC/CorC family transporter [Ureibacillus terrenus]